MKNYLLPAMAILLMACTSAKKDMTETPEIQAADPHSFAVPAKAVVKHLEWDATVDFDRHQIQATATWTISQGEGGEIVFDSRDLNIQRVWLDDQTETTFTIGEPDPERPYMGVPLAVQIKPETQKVSIQYQTAADAAALQWLNADQTRDKKHPFLFTQSQAILARTWIPCQDGPGIRFTYDARVQVPAGMLALMSAENPQQVNESGLYTFKMEQPIPSYLMALAVGDLAFQSLGRNTGVYTEPGFLEACVWELADMQSMLDKAEALYGTYAWGRYDVIVLPPSFPFGGMENPRITFATPTIIAGDRSLTALVAHELAHSWSGNLVTNANWNDFWLNEGFTVYFENRIMEAVYGAEYARMLQVLEYNDVMGTIAEMGEDAPDTHLKLNLSERDPDEGMSDIAYNKGAYFLRMLEQTAGREKMDAFLKAYFTEHAFKVMDTEQFVEYLNQKLIEPNATAFEDVDINAWIYGPGMPQNCPVVVSERFNQVDSMLALFVSGTPPGGLNTAGWSTHEWLRFLKGMPSSLTAKQMAVLDKAYSLTGTGNCEVADVWYELAIQKGYTEAYDDIEIFLTSVGRRKFLTPLYKAMVATPEGKEMALRIYEKARPGYHYVAVNTLDALLGWQ